MSAPQLLIARDGLKLAWYVHDFTDPWTTPDTLLLLHAAMGNSRRWFRWIPRLARQYRVLSMDLRGHGASEFRPRASRFRSTCWWMMRRCTGRADAATAHVVGNSAGGYVAQKLAIHHAARVKTLALYGAPPGLKNSHALTWLPLIGTLGLKRFLRDTIHERFDVDADPELVDWFIEQAGSNDPAFIGRFVSHMCTHDFMDEVQRIVAPTLIVAAGKEAIGNASAYQRMHELIAPSQLVQYDTAAHNICDAYPDRCVDDLLQFLRPAS